MPYIDIQARVWIDPKTGVIRITSNDEQLVRDINVAVPAKGSAAHTIRQSLGEGDDTHSGALHPLTGEGKGDLSLPVGLRPDGRVIFHSLRQDRPHLLIEAPQQSVTDFIAEAVTARGFQLLSGAGSIDKALEIMESRLRQMHVSGTTNWLSQPGHADDVVVLMVDAEQVSPYSGHLLGRTYADVLKIARQGRPAGVFLIFSTPSLNREGWLRRIAVECRHLWHTGVNVDGKLTGRYGFRGRDGGLHDSVRLSALGEV